ncbi:MAG: phosphate uptake regulator PhoU [Vulcanisaeta sp.]|uniref:phosphate signaling complex PhoU family protein n=1 Tax=Vulcanisaeta sp. EB80 TaxID=1650660 RepID=UPI0009C194E1|nr:phosphate uptake regulator PhoU [Vulcanisaeta sp. EB80]MCG2865529.1 phosphate uptake regulator PhoU [Vulcanisaeta sp.]MCG2867282.1 phosphate uptake regulator PhoU [Vulcanisaeta sp.]MCG2886103.1 phosphate uptake regulator PhoU [Vulcanisaeta sp.]MDT7863672.1 phosphate uptake regulator PhoU [Vulcanisaeta sp.]MDT7970307.1 phosphate uptake regulator PhoU [Vulcanisaeta sp.]
MSSIYRRVIRIGEKSIGITLPKRWLDTINVGIGDVVEVSLIGKVIVVKPITQAGGETNEVSISLSGAIDETTRIIIASYIEGYDNVEIIGHKDTIRKAFSSVEHKLPGSLMLEGDGNVLIKVATSEVNVDLNEVISSMANILNSMFGKFIDYLNSNKLDLLKEVLELDDQMDKLYFLALRTIKKLSFKDPKRAIDDTIVVKNLEHAADALDRLSNAFMRTQPAQCRREISEKLKDVWSYVMKAVYAYLDNNINNALKVLLDRERMLNSMLELANMGCMGLSGLLTASIHEGQLIVALAADIAEAAFSRHVRSIAKPAKIPTSEELGAEE